MRSPAVDFDEKRVDAIFSELNQCHLPGAAVGIAIGGKPVYRKGFGLASMELPIALSPGIRMRIASTTKHFTCLAYLLLCEEGKAGIDDRIGKYLPELHPIAHEITVRQLMGHVGGLRDAHDIRHQLCGTRGPTSVAEVLSLYRDIGDVNFAAGTGWNYNNGGYLILSAVIERIAAQALDQVLRERIFEPSGLHDTLLRRWDSGFVSNSATMHMTTVHGGFDRSYIGKEHVGEGGIVTTVNDLLRWLAQLDAPVVGSATTWALMKTPLTLANGVSTGYGLGLIVARYRGVETLSHAGGLMGANSQMLKVPTAGLDVVVLANRHDVNSMALAEKILDACLPDLDPIAKKSGGVLATGIFHCATTGDVIELFSREGQQIASINGADTPFEAGEDSILRPVPMMSAFKYEIALIGDRERPAAIRFSEFGNLYDLAAVHPADGPDTEAIVGRYQSKATGIEATIAASADGPRLFTVGRLGSAEFQLQCLARGVWRARAAGPIPWGGVLSFNAATAAFRFSSLRTRALPFQRRA